MTLKINPEEAWVKVVDFLQQNWAVIKIYEDNGTVAVVFIDDGSRIFDEIKFYSQVEAEDALHKNGFTRYIDRDYSFKKYIIPPREPFVNVSRPIYSSAKFWIS